MTAPGARPRKVLWRGPRPPGSNPGYTPGRVGPVLAPPGAGTPYGGGAGYRPDAGTGQGEAEELPGAVSPVVGPTAGMSAVVEELRRRFKTPADTRAPFGARAY